MTLSVWDLTLYAIAVFVLFLTPGPVWLALMARTLSGGFRAAWPLALGVSVGDMVWPVIAIAGVSWVAAASAQIAQVLKLLAVAVFVVLGVATIKNADRPVSTDNRLTRPGLWPGFVAGVAVILGNPKAVLFYMGILPGFFDLSRVTGFDVIAIVFVSQIVPLAGNLLLAAFVDRARALLRTPGALRRTNIVAGSMLIAVGLILPFT
ncbi:MAG: LysE family translocator [Pseudomonadota bacterium]